MGIYVTQTQDTQDTQTHDTQTQDMRLSLRWILRLRILKRKRLNLKLCSSVVVDSWYCIYVTQTQDTQDTQTQETQTRDTQTQDTQTEDTQDCKFV